MTKQQPRIPSTMLNSCIYEGVVMHERVAPKRHRLNYRVFSMLVDLDELDGLDKTQPLFSHNRFNLFSIHDRDHGPGKQAPLKPYMEDTLLDAGIDVRGGRIRMLCYPRIMGYVFNPLSVYFCEDANGRLRAIVYEVNNTFKERHSYLIAVDGQEDKLIRQTCEKAFYVSPFIQMDATYHFAIKPPKEKIGITIRQTTPAGPLLTATFTGKKRPLSRWAFARLFVKYPLMSLKVIVGIHIEALKLWRKGVKVVKKPAPPANSVSVIKKN